MTQKEKQLLLKDLCARLPYGVKGRYCLYDSKGNLTDWGNEPEIVENIDLQKEKIWTDDTVQGYYLDEFKMYLRPMDSMTKEEKEEITKMSTLISSITLVKELGDWLNEHHFDYRGLIEKGLALEALEGIYKTEKKMNYEEKYNKAMEDMRAIYPNLKGDAKLAVEHAFHELRESEDERIIKTLQEYVRNRNWSLNGPTQDEALAWLEKQKEHNLEDIEDKAVRKYMKLDKFALANMLAERDKTNAEVIEAFESIEGQPAEKLSTEELLSSIKSLQHEQPEVDLEKEIETYFKGWYMDETDQGYILHTPDDHAGLMSVKQIARHFYELGLNTRKEEKK